MDEVPEEDYQEWRSDKLKEEGSYVGTGGKSKFLRPDQEGYGIRHL